MTVKESVKNETNFIVTKDGKILAINRINKVIENLEVKKTQIIEGIIKDLVCIRV